MNIRSIFVAVVVIVGSVNFVYGQKCYCRTCSEHLLENAEEYWREIRQRRLKWEHDQGQQLGPQQGTSGQVVFLDFDSGNDGSVDYTQERRDMVQKLMEGHYEGFDVTLVQTQPPGDHSTIVFNEGFPGGLAEDIDFRNLNKNDSAVVNVQGLPGVTGDLVVPSSAVIGSHELGHILGLKHEDSFGPISCGIQPGFNGLFNPSYPGPNGANESFDHIMTTPAFGASVGDTLTPSWLGEREAIKVALADVPASIEETADPNDSVATAQPIAFLNYTVPNKIQSGLNAGLGDFSVDMAVVEGSLTGNVDTIDYYEFQGSAGDLINIEVISDLPDRFAGNRILSEVSVFDSSGSFVSYYGTNAFNVEGISGEESQIIDLTLPADGPFIVAVNAISAIDSGLYELFVNRFNGEADFLLGDVNCDGVVDLLDVNPFIELLMSSGFSEKADINQDGSVNLLDVDPFVQLIIGD